MLPALALLRLILLYALCCFLLLYSGLLLRTEREVGHDLYDPLPPTSHPLFQLPFLGINLVPDSSVAIFSMHLAHLRATGFGWVRQRFDWGRLEPQPGHFNWQPSDALLRAITASGLIPVVVLDGSPAWARAVQDTGPGENPLAPPTDPATFARFAAAFAARYGDQVRYYQIWDEPNVAPHWGNQLIEPVQYAWLLKAAATAIREVDADAVIITAALAPTADRGHTAIDEIYFLQRLYAAGAASAFDAVAVQPFGFANPPDDPRQQLLILNFARLQLVRRAMLAAGDGATPLLATRFGWNTQPGSPWRTVSPANQQAFTVQALTQAYNQWPWLAGMAWAADTQVERLDTEHTGCAHGFFFDVNRVGTPCNPCPNCAEEADTASTGCAHGFFFDVSRVGTPCTPCPNCAEKAGTVSTGCVHGFFFDVNRVGTPCTPCPNCASGEATEGFALTPGLVQALATWQSDVNSTQRPRHGSGARSLTEIRVSRAGDVTPADSQPLPNWFFAWSSLVVISLVAGWRTVAAARQLPWRNWKSWWLQQATLLRVILWLLLLAAYFFATWPPLILLCLLLAALLILADPLVGCWLVALTLPFYFQHKTIQLVDGVWNLVPAHAALLCLLPAVISHIKPKKNLRHLRNLRIGFCSWDWLAVGWLVINLLAAINVWHWPAYGNGLYELVFMPLLGYCALRLLITSEQQRRSILVAMLCGALVATAGGLVAWWQGGGVAVDGIRRLVGPYYSPNHLALYLERIFFIGLGLSWVQSGRIRWWLWSACVVIGLGLVLTASRGLMGFFRRPEG